MEKGLLVFLSGLSWTSMDSIRVQIPFYLSLMVLIHIIPISTVPDLWKKKQGKMRAEKNDPIVFPCVIPTTKQFLTNELYHSFQGL